MSGRYAYARLATDSENAQMEMKPMKYTAPSFIPSVKPSDEEHGLEEVGDGTPQAYDRWRHQKNLDRFFRRCYKYYCGKGVACIVMARVFDFAIVLFVAFIVLFLIYCVDYPVLHARMTSQSLVHADLFTPDNSTQIIAPMSWSRLNSMSHFGIAVTSIFGLGYGFCFLTFLLSVPELIEMRNFFTESLQISYDELTSISWSDVLLRLMEAQKRHHLCITVREFDQLDITNLITRRVNYMIALYAKHVLPTDISVPYFGEYHFLPLMLQWSIDYVLKRCIFDSFGNIRLKVLDKGKESHEEVSGSLRFYFKLIGTFTLLLSPAIFIYRVAVFIFQHSDEIRNFSGRVSSRHFSPYACWKLRDFCEVDHYFRKRLAKCHEPATLYFSSFTSEITVIIARFVSVIVGGIFFMLISFGLVFEGFILAYLTPARSVTWYIGVTGILLALCRSIIPDENKVCDPVKKMHVIALHSHYFPETWRGRECSSAVVTEFGRLFQHRLVSFLEEILGTAIVPYLLITRLPKHASSLATFFRTHTSRQEGIGDVCTFALFGTRTVDTMTDSISSMSHPQSDMEKDTEPLPPGTVIDIPFHPTDAKIEHSLINFKVHNVDWKPDLASSQFLERVSNDVLSDKALSLVSLATHRQNGHELPFSTAEDSSTDDGLQLHHSLFQPSPSRPRLGTIDSAQPSTINTFLTHSSPMRNSPVALTVNGDGRNRAGTF